MRKSLQLLIDHLSVLSPLGALGGLAVIVLLVHQPASATANIPDDGHLIFLPLQADATTRHLLTGDSNPPQLAESENDSNADRDSGNDLNPYRQLDLALPSIAALPARLALVASVQNALFIPRLIFLAPCDRPPPLAPLLPA